MSKVAILNGYKLILPKYGKHCGIYGIFTTEGFVSCNGDNSQDLEIEEIQYEGFFEINSQEEFDKIQYPEF